MEAFHLGAKWKVPGSALGTQIHQSAPPQEGGVTVTQVPACPESGGMLSVSKGAGPVFERRACGECK